MASKRVDPCSRRTAIATAVTAAAATAGTMWTAGSNATAAEATPKKKVMTYTNADFYDANGKFLIERAREAYYDMFQRFGYPVSDTLRKEMWILEFGLGDFVHAGMAGIFWLNRQDYGYFGHEIYLLPGQMIPEHCHLATEKGPPKMESWQPRRGMIYTFGEGEPTPEYVAKVPESQRDLIRSRHCKPLGIDEIGHLNRLKAFHFMLAGPEGALVTEYGTFHDMDGLRFSNPKATL